MKKIGSLRPLLNLNKNNTPFSLSPFKNILYSPPLGQCLKLSYLYCGWLPWRKSCWGQGIQWTKRESDGLWLIIPLTVERDHLVMHYSQSLANYGGRFWKEIGRGGGSIFLLKNSKVVLDTHFLWWEQFRLLIHPQPPFPLYRLFSFEDPLPLSIKSE